MIRRHFLTAAALSVGRVRGANDRIRIGAIGTGGRCTYLLTLAKQAKGTEIVALSDIYGPRLNAAKQKVAVGAREYHDYRTLLEQKDIDAVIIGSPDHWHVPMTLDAIAAGKDVYVEKPVSHTIEEGERLLQAASVSRQIIQVGYQQRSWEHFQAARDIVRWGKLGQVTLILSSWYQDYLSRLNNPPPVDASKLDWKRFLGSAPDQPFEPLRFSRWRWFWDFGGGHLTDLYSHLGDVIHWFMYQDSPLATQATGGRHALPQFECPETINAAFEYPGFHVVYNGTLAGSLEGGNLVFRGSDAVMKLNRDGFQVYPERVVPFEKTQYPDPIASMKSTGDGTIAHMQNFLDCVRNRKLPNSDVASAVASARVAHLGNLAYRKGLIH